MFKLVVLSALLAFAMAVPHRVPISAIKNVQPHIIHGEEAVPHSIPYQVWMEVQSGDEAWLCGGSLISSKYVLTAGHCVFEGDSAEVLLGAHNINEKEDTQVVVKAKRLILHEDYDDELIKNDIGLLELVTEVKETDAIKIAKLSTEADNTFVNSTGKVSGWGLTGGFNKDVSPVLMFEEDTIISNEECEKYFSGAVFDTNICLNAKSGRGSCNGDSGGPLTVEDKIVGIVSYGIIWCLPRFPSVFTRSTSYLKWIQENSDVVV